MTRVSARIDAFQRGVHRSNPRKRLIVVAGARLAWARGWPIRSNGSATCSWRGIWRRGDDLGAAAAGRRRDHRLQPPGGHRTGAAGRRRGRQAGRLRRQRIRARRRTGQLAAAAQRIAIVYDRNMSLGITVLERSVREAAASLGAEGSISRSPRSTTSTRRTRRPGTALKLGEAIARRKGCSRYRRRAIRGRAPNGEVPGDHRVVHAHGDGEIDVRAQRDDSPRCSSTARCGRRAGSSAAAAGAIRDGGCPVRRPFD